MENLSDFLNSKTSKFKFELIDRELTIRRMTLHDDAWVESEFSPEDVAGAMNIRSHQHVDAETRKRYQSIIVRIFYRALDNESKQYICSLRPYCDIDENGKEVVIEGLSGPEKLERLIAGPIEFLQMFKAFEFAKNVSNPLITEILKKANNRAEGNPEKKHPGRKSTTK